MRGCRQKCVIFTIMKNTLFLILSALLFVACGNDSSTSANNSNDGDNSSKSSSSQRSVSSSSGKVAELVDPADVIVGSMTDSRDGQTYKTVTIGEQTWMAQNLNYETADSYCYNDTSSYCAKYGRLYTWAAAMDSVGSWSVNGNGCGYGSTCSPTGTIRGVCPEGWHLPTKSEWEILFDAVGGISIAGMVLKSTSGWNEYEGHDGNGTDAFSFSVLPAGDRYYGWLYDGGEGDLASFWSSAEYDSDFAYRMDLFYSREEARMQCYGPKNFENSVRCLKD